MGQWTDYWRIITPKTSKQKYSTARVDTGDHTGEYGYTNYSWYNQIMRGAGTRMQKYIQFDNMDADVDVARALDTISEEMTNNDDNGLPFEIEYNNDDNKEVDESIVMTVKAALRHWADIHDLDNKIFKIARNTIKYGDCFFEKTSDFKQWKFIPASMILGIELNKENEIIAYHLKVDGNGDYSTLRSNTEILTIPAKNVVHFTLSDNMDDNTPFGDSVLTPVVKSFKQMNLLEDAVVIYRVVRAPERRVFYIDVGGMPAHKVKKYLETVKNEMKQKRIPNDQGGQEKVDGIYNPMSMVEDYFFGSTSNGRGSRVETLPGGDQTGENGDVRYFQDKVFRGLRVPKSYMRSNSETPNAVYNDGKTGVAYIEELRFANYVRRLQLKIEKVFDREFKEYLIQSKIDINPNLFNIKLPVPQNFELYRQTMLNTDLMSSFSQADGISYLSKRFILKKYLGFSEDDIQTNEALLRQERSIPETDDISLAQDIQYMYDPDYLSNRQVELPEDPNKSEGEVYGNIEADEERGLDDTSGDSDITSDKMDDTSESEPKADSNLDSELADIDTSLASDRE